MHKLAIVFVVLLTMAVNAQAQDTPRLEVFGGYSYDRAVFPLRAPQTTNVPNGRGGLHGWNAAVAVSLNRWLSVAADAGAFYGPVSSAADVEIPPPCFECVQPISGTLHSVQTFTFGPQLSHRDKRLTLFARALFGVARTREDLSPPAAFTGVLFDTITESNFATILDGGADVSLSRRFAVRVQPGYLMTHMLDRRQNNFRLSAGIVFRFAKK